MSEEQKPTIDAQDTPEEFDFYFSDPARWHERQRENPELRGLNPVDISWIDDSDGCGPKKLSNPIRCF